MKTDPEREVEQGQFLGGATIETVESLGSLCCAPLLVAREWVHKGRPLAPEVGESHFASLTCHFVPSCEPLLY